MPAIPKPWAIDDSGGKMDKNRICLPGVYLILRIKWSLVKFVKMFSIQIGRHVISRRKNKH